MELTGENLGEQKQMLDLSSSDRYVEVDVGGGDVLLEYGGVTGPCRGLAVATNGVVVTLNSLGDSVSHTLTAGSVHPIATRTVVSIGTTATGIVAHF